MSVPTEAGPVDPTEPEPWKRSSKVQVVILVVNIAFWAAILGWTVMSGDVEPPDRLEDPAFGVEAEARCGEAVTDIESLGLPTQVDTPAERADMVDEENVLLTAMVSDLAALPRPAGEQGEWVTRWLEDWRVHIADRQDWADDLRVGDDHAFIETDRAGEQISNVIDNFAEVNEMPSCATSGDV